MTLRIIIGQSISPTQLFMQCPTLNIPLVKQKPLLRWCWAACAEMVLRYYGRNVDKCEVANWLLSRINCCPTNAVCDRICLTGDVCRIYKHWKIHCPSPTLSHVSFKTLKDEICAKRPVEVGLAENGADVGHLVIVKGCYKDGFEQWAVINDPLLAADRDVLYSWLLYNEYYGFWSVTWTGLEV